VISQKDKDFILSSIDWSALAGKRILITGGSGFIGHWLGVAPKSLLIASLNRLQYEYGNWHKYEWDWIIHLANVSPERVIECAQRNGAGILFASSGAVYDKDPGEYALEKIHSERMLWDSGLVVKIARMFTFTGAHMRNHFAVTNYILDAISGSQIKIRGDNVTRCYMYAADMAVWLWRIVLDGVPGRAYEVGSNHEITMQGLAGEIARNFEPRPEIIEERIYGPDARPVYVPTGLARTMGDLGVTHTVGFKDAIARTIESYYKAINGGML
jgi:nucleoside-diphosphate-sugar epimerase